jgi:hypothetical protein
MSMKNKKTSIHYEEFKVIFKFIKDLIETEQELKKHGINIDGLSDRYFSVIDLLFDIAAPETSGRSILIYDYIYNYNKSNKVCKFKDLGSDKMHKISNVKDLYKYIFSK